MPEKLFGFLFELTEDEGKEWLRRYLRGEATKPPVPFDLQPLEFLLGEVNPMRDPELPLRVGTLAGKLLAEAIGTLAYRTADIREIEALFTLVESLPVSEEIVEFLNDLAITGRLLEPHRETDLHLLTLRALILHQQLLQGAIDRRIAFWERELEDIRYAAVALQGLFRVSVVAAINALPEFVRRARSAVPPIPLANTLFTVSVELGRDRSLWAALVKAFDGWEDDLNAVREAFQRTRFAESNPDAWAMLQSQPSEPQVGVPFASRYSQDADQIERARRRLNGALLLAA